MTQAEATAEVAQEVMQRRGENLRAADCGDGDREELGKRALSTPRLKKSCTMRWKSGGVPGIAAAVTDGRTNIVCRAAGVTQQGGSPAGGWRIPCSGSPR